MVNFADDCSPYEFNQFINQVIQNLETQTAYLSGTSLIILNPTLINGTLF